MKQRTLSPNSASGGFSLVELMIALALGLVLVLGLSSVFISSKQGYRVQESSGRMQESLRFALDIIGRELRHADFWAGVSASEVNNGVPGSSSAACDPPWHADPAFGIEGFDGGAASPAAGCTVGSYVANSDVLVTRYADPNDLPTAAYLAAPANADQLIVRTLVGRNAYLFEAADLATAIAQVPDLAGAFNHRFRSVALSLGVPTGDTTPTLYACDSQLSCGDGGNPQQMVNGVEQMQFAYGVDTNGDLAADVFRAAGAMAAADWGNVIAVRAGLVIRGDEVDEFLDTQTYNLPGGFSYTPAAADQRFQRRVVVKDFQVRNRTRN